MELLSARELLGLQKTVDDPVAREEEIQKCRDSFIHFLSHWRFTDRESGEVKTLSNLWDGQAKLAELMERERQIFALKAGKLGFTELECAYDAWVALFRQRNARVHIFSKDATAAQELIQYIRFGLTHLPGWLQLPIPADTSGGDTVRSLKLRAGMDDIRTIVSYPAAPHVAIDQTATHSHVDELAHMPFPDRTWSSIQTTIAPGGSCHIVSRGAGDDDFVVTLWEAAQEAASNLVPFFAPWSARPREDGWREAQEMTMPMQGFLHFAPESPEDALAGDETSIYIPIEVWDRCFDPNLPALEDDFDTPLVLGLDASVKSDMFGIVVVSRHPERPAEAAIRVCRAWKPGDFPDGRIDYEEVERFIRFVCGGGCPNRHPRSLPEPHCEECKDGNFTRRGYNVVQLAYDPYQMEDMAQRLRRDQVVWCDEFPQTGDRLIADAQLHQLAMRRAISHTNDPMLREHISNARAKLSKDEDRTMRIVKKSPSRKIDLAVAASMAVARVLYLRL